MSLTVIVTNDVKGRFRGFLGSAMLELAPGVYVSPRLNRNVRERMWEVIDDWHRSVKKPGSIVMIWRAKGAPGNIEMRILGEPKKEIVEVDKLWLAKRPNRGKI